jgi:hypothetical protein
VQRTEVFRDSLDTADIPESINKSAKVVDEGGNIVEVVFDPVLKCYYEPK